MRTAKVHCIQADVTRRGSRPRSGRGGRNCGRRCAGIIHAAGLFDASLMENTLPLVRFAEILRPKLGRCLEPAPANAEPAPWTSSSVSRPWPRYCPLRGQAHYAGANAFPGCPRPRARRADGLSALAINWGPWAEVLGMGQRVDPGDLRRRQQSLGLPEIETAGGLTALAELLGSLRGRASGQRDAHRVEQAVPSLPCWPGTCFPHPDRAQQERRRRATIPGMATAELNNSGKPQRKEQDHLRRCEYAKQQLAGVLGAGPGRNRSLLTGYL